MLKSSLPSSEGSTDSKRERAKPSGCNRHQSAGVARQLSLSVRYCLLATAPGDISAELRWKKLQQESEYAIGKGISLWSHDSFLPLKCKFKLVRLSPTNSSIAPAPACLAIVPLPRTLPAGQILSGGSIAAVHHPVPEPDAPLFQQPSLRYQACAEFRTAFPHSARQRHRSAEPSSLLLCLVFRIEDPRQDDSGFHRRTRAGGGCEEESIFFLCQ